MTRTSQYPFNSLAVGNYFIVAEQFQHARVATSEFGRKNGVVFSCRKQPDGTMRVYRVEASQATVDNRGRQGRRRIPNAVSQPTKQQFCEWLNTFAPGYSFLMPDTYSQSFQLIQAWTELYSLKTGVQFKSAIQANGLLIARSN